MKSKIIAIVAATIDGKIATSSAHFSNWTSPEDKTFMHNLLDKSDIIVIGNNTYKTAVQPLSKRNCMVFTRSVKTMEQKSDELLLCNPELIDVPAVLQRYPNVAVLGGTQTYTYFLENNLLNEIYLTIEPLIFGKGLAIFESLKTNYSTWKLIGIKALNNKGTILLHYKIID
jgi:dihydrofolate reductase